MDVALSEVLVTGGIPPDITLSNSADDVYEHTYERVITQNKKFYRRYPGAGHDSRIFKRSFIEGVWIGDVEVVQKIVRHIMSQPDGFVSLPSGSRLTPRSLQLLGCLGLGYAGGFDRLHYLLDTAFDGNRLSYRFLKVTSFITPVTSSSPPLKCRTMSLG